MPKMDLDDSQTVREWLHEFTEKAAGWLSIDRLFLDWQRWLMRKRGLSSTRIAFAESLKRQGFAVARLSNGLKVQGLRLKPQPTPYLDRLLERL